jgi:hypothetical protein
MVELGKLLKDREIPFHSRDNRIMCFPHVVNIVTQQVVSSLTTSPISDDEAASDGDGRESSDDDDNDKDSDDESSNNTKKHRDDNHSDEIQPQSLHMARKGPQTYEDALKNDPISLCRNVIRAIWASGQRRDDFDDMIENGNAKGWFVIDGDVVEVPHLQLLRDVKTRWDSIFLMIKRFIELQPVSSNSCGLRVALSHTTCVRLLTASYPKTYTRWTIFASRRKNGKCLEISLSS